MLCVHVCVRALKHTFYYAYRPLGQTREETHVYFPTLSVCVCVCGPQIVSLTLSLSHTHTISHTHKRPERRKSREWWKLRQLVVTKIKRAERTKESQVCLCVCVLLHEHAHNETQKQRHVYQISWKGYVVHVQFWTHFFMYRQAQLYATWTVKKQICEMCSRKRTHTHSISLSHAQATWAKTAPKIRGMQKSRVGCCKDEALWKIEQE